MATREAPATGHPTRAASLGDLLLRAAERRGGDALRYSHDGRLVGISYPALGAAGTLCAGAQGQAQGRLRALRQRDRRALRLTEAPR